MGFGSGSYSNTLVWSVASSSWAGLVTPGGTLVPLFATFPGVFETLIPFQNVAERTAMFPHAICGLVLDGMPVGSLLFDPTVRNGFASISSP